MVEKENIDAVRIATIGIVCITIAFVLICMSQVLYYRVERADEYGKFVVPGYTALKTLQTEQRQALADYKWVDRQKETVTIPIERAMDLVVRDLQAQKQ